MGLLFIFFFCFLLLQKTIPEQISAKILQTLGKFFILTTLDYQETLLVSLKGVSFRRGSDWCILAVLDICVWVQIWTLWLEDFVCNENRETADQARHSNKLSSCTPGRQSNVNHRWVCTLSWNFQKSEQQAHFVMAEAITSHSLDTLVAAETWHQSGANAALHKSPSFQFSKAKVPCKDMPFFISHH